MSTTFILVCLITCGFYSVLGKSVQLNESGTTNVALKFTGVSSFFAALPVFVILLFTPERAEIFVMDFNEWPLVLFLGVISTGFGLFLLFLVLKHVEVSRGMSLAFLKPIFATVLAFFLLSETPTIALIVSICLFVISILLINTK
ncbi:MAG: EamA family transporter [Candidatus Lokiarchaeota archaeon]|nr:EamA family transporter [Candidatus Lokiarchaeota archaeon]